MRIMADPGHGGRDVGAVGPTGLREKDVVLAVCLRLQELLSPERVLLTRSTDAYLTLAARARLANAASVSACVSVHCNAHTTPQAHGVETFHLTGRPRAAVLAQHLQRQLVAATGWRDRGVKTATFALVRLPRMPAALVELGFISNPAEEARLRDEVFRARLAQALADGIMGFLVSSQA